MSIQDNKAISQSPGASSPGATSDITTLSAIELAQRMTAGALAAREVVEAHIRRIEFVNPSLNAVVVPLFEQARAEASLADARREDGQPLGPLHGVPITIKESIHVAGTASTGGMHEQAKQKAAADSPLVARMREAGAIILGKTNVPQLLLYIETDNPLYGRTNNPWNLERSPGGSSGGEAAIIAAGGSALGLGTDIGGSLRVPAHYCGLHSLKPTSGRLSEVGTLDKLILPGMEAIIGQPGALARSVGDLSLVMSILAAPGQEAFDPSIAPVPWRDPSAISIRDLRVAYYTDDGFFPAAPAMRRAVREAADALRGCGATVEEFRPPDVPQAIHLYYQLGNAGSPAWAKPLFGKGKRDRRIGASLAIAGLPHSICTALGGVMDLVGQPNLATVLRSAGTQSTKRYWQLVTERDAYRERFLAALDGGRFDALLCPPNAHPALTHGSSFYLNVPSYTMLYNLLGMPAGVVAATRVRPGEECDRPASRDIVQRTARVVEMGSAGLPVGVQVAARHWREDVVLAVMGALEKHFRTQADYPAFPPLDHISKE